MVKKSSTLANTSKNSIEKKDIEELANELSERPYGEPKESEKSNFVRTTISIDSNVLIKIEDRAQLNKRNKKGLKSVSAIMREALDEYCAKYEV